MARAEDVQVPSEATPPFSLSALPRRFLWAAALGVVLIVMLASLAIWGSNMEFQTTVSSTPSSDGSVMIDKSLRQVTSEVIDNVVSWMTQEGGWLFDGVRASVEYVLVQIENVLKWIPWPAIVIGLALLSFAVGGWSMAAFTVFTLLFVGYMGYWENTIDTIALMVVAVAISVAIGLPLGVLGARSTLADNIMRPILDGMQTMPSFVYLLPGILFLGLGKPAGIFATIIYAVPPVIRLTNLGIRQVSAEAVEAARSFGATPLQLLAKVQIPMALPTIMAGINQTTMMALAMVTIASMVAAGGLGDNVLRALQKNQPGQGALAGLTIVFLAIVIDRLTQSVAARRQESMRSVG